MLKELLSEDRTSRVADLKKLRHTLERFVSRGEKRKLHPLGKLIFGIGDHYKRTLPVELEAKEYELKVSTEPSPWSDKADNRSIRLALYTKDGDEVGVYYLPSLSFYSRLSPRSVIAVNKALELIGKDIIPLIEQEITKDGSSKGVSS